MVDCNCPWTVADAIEMAHRLMPFNLKWLEEPVWPPEDHAGLARVQAQGGIPTAAGENAMLPEFKGMLEAGAISYAQPSVTKVGGVTQMRRVMALADAFGITVVPHSAYFARGSSLPSTVSPRYQAAAWSNATTPISRLTRCTTPSCRTRMVAWRCRKARGWALTRTRPLSRSCGSDKLRLASENR
jgi:Enolase C-terminal domain-like